MNGTMVRLAEANIRTFVEIQNAFDECDPEIQEVIHSMFGIMRDSEADADEKDRAMGTVLDALFPSLSVDDMGAERTIAATAEAMKHKCELDEQEATFADRLRGFMKDAGLTQQQLADKTNVSQSAISNMLNRECRPQGRTISRLAEALGVDRNDLWPFH